MKLKSLSRLLCLGCLAVVGVFAQDAPPPPAPDGAPAGGGAGGGPGGGRPGGGRGNFDPAQFQQRMVARIQETLAATADEWKVIEPRLTAVMEKQRASRELQGGRSMFGRRPGGPGGAQPEQPAELTAVEKAAEAGDAAGIKTALESLRKARTDRDVEVTKARTALREVLTPAQEAKLVVLGILD
jgi:Spy/CpxP family protein refolding chaperone